MLAPSLIPYGHALKVIQTSILSGLLSDFLRQTQSIFLDCVKFKQELFARKSATGGQVLQKTQLTYNSFCSTFFKQRGRIQHLSPTVFVYRLSFFSLYNQLESHQVEFRVNLALQLPYQNCFRLKHEMKYLLFTTGLASPT